MSNMSLFNLIFNLPVALLFESYRYHTRCFVSCHVATIIDAVYSVISAMQVKHTALHTKSDLFDF